MPAGASPTAAIRPARFDDAPLIADILADAFREDPVMTWALGGPGRPHALFLELARHIYLRRGFGHVTGDFAATLWLPAGERSTPGLWGELNIAYAVLKRAGFSALARGKRVGDIMAANHPVAPHFYLFAVGVRDGRKGQGHGGAILCEGLKRADEAGAPAYLENSNPRNTALYQRLGFAAQDELPLPSGAPPLLAMLRAPLRSGEA